MNSFFSRPTRPCAKHAPLDGSFYCSPWVIGKVATIFLALLFISQCTAFGAHKLLYSSAFSGYAMTADGFNKSLLPDIFPSGTPSNPTVAAIISGWVWWDSNDSKTIDNAELGIPGALVKLFSQSNPNTLVAAAWTNSQGAYSLTVAPGNYFLLNATPSIQGENLLIEIPNSQVQIDPNSNRFLLNLTNVNQAQELDFGERTFPSSLISKSLFLTSSDPLVPAPEPSVWLELFSAGLMGLGYFMYKGKRSTNR